MTVPYPNLCYNEKCNKGTVLQRNDRKMTFMENLQRNYRKIIFMDNLQRNNRKMTILWSFSYNFFVKLYV